MCAEYRVAGVPSVVSMRIRRLGGLAALALVHFATTEKLDGPAIGIDLGTTYSCVGIFKSGRVEIIPNDQGNRITPSYVSFLPDGERLLGEAAKNQAALHPAQTLFDVKRLIGRRFADETVQKDIRLLPYRVADSAGAPAIEIDIAGQRRQLRPEEVSAMVLTKMKTTAETYLGRSVKYAVVTVPAYFNDAQRTATKDAGAIAGLDILRIVNEPTAAAVAYGLDSKGQGEKNILVYDLGGGTFDVSVMQIDNGVFEVMATNGDTHLGGEDFDQRLIEHFTGIFKKKHSKDLTRDKRAVQKLRQAVEKAKRSLSSTHQVRVEVEALYEGIDMSEPLSRAKFEELNNDLFKRTLEPLKQVMEDSGLRKTQIDEVVLVGGSTRIPKVQDMISKFFGGKQLKHGINPDEAVAYGAAVQAGIISGAAESTDLLLLDVTPLTLGIETTGGRMSNIIERNTLIPTKKRVTYGLGEGRTDTNIRVFEGERPLVKDNHMLAEFKLTGFSEGGDNRHDVIFDIDNSGILTVTAEITSNGQSKSLTISNKEGLSQTEVERLVREAEQFAETDRQSAALTDARVGLEAYLRSTELALQRPPLSDQLSSDDLALLQDALASARSWLEEREQAAADVEEMREKHLEVQSICGPILESHLGAGSGDASSSAADEEEVDFDEL